MPHFPKSGRYRKLGPTLQERFGEQIHKVTLRGGFGCPNRDGRVGTGGCIFCSEMALLPASGPMDGPIEAQLEAGLAVARKQRGTEKAIAYFQDQTATDAPTEVLSDLYRRAIAHPRVVALSLGTRPDWIQEEVFDLLGDLARQKPVFLELGLQTANDTILKAINRGHTVSDFERAVRRAHRAGLEVVAHVILDLPSETAKDRLKTAACLNRTGVEGVKVHNLHVLKGTPLAKLYQEGKVRLCSLTDYARIATNFLKLLSPAVVIHRLTGEGPAHLMLAPSWGRQKGRIIQEIENMLSSEDGWQGKLYQTDGRDLC